MKKPLIVIGIVALVILGGVGVLLANRPNETPASPIVEKKEKTYNMEQLLNSVISKFPTVTATKVYTEATDPNGNLGKPGYYVQGGAFADSRVGEFSATDSSWGADAGGSIEIYQTEADAKERVAYLEAFQGNPVTDPGAFKQSGKVVVRASEKLDKTAQDELIDYMTSLVS